MCSNPYIEFPHLYLASLDDFMVNQSIERMQNIERVRKVKRRSEYEMSGVGG